MKIKTVLFVASLLCSPFLWAEKSPLHGLEALTGSWKLQSPQTPQEKAFRLNYRLISKNTTLVEDYGDPAQQITETLYHRDGEKLLATHYCARGNQPRLALHPDADDKTLVFEFQDITNLAHKSDPHMVGMRFVFIDAEHFEKEETYLVNGEPHVSRMLLVRAD